MSRGGLAQIAVFVGFGYSVEAAVRLNCKEGRQGFLLANTAGVPKAQLGRMMSDRQCEGTAKAKVEGRYKARKTYCPIEGPTDPCVGEPRNDQE